ncbi:MAG TPA: hypothetical protein VEC93_07845, partial [Anaerolineae bacterium]|nr:hypothetical protein [Anaerolineae bacterium]
MTKTIINAHRLRNALLYPQASVRKLVRATQRQLNPNWLGQLEQMNEGKIQWVSPQDIHFI